MNSITIQHILRVISEYLPLIIFLVLTPLMLLFFYRQRQKQIEKLKALAIKLGFRFLEGESGSEAVAFPQGVTSSSSPQRLRTERTYHRLERSGLLSKLQLLAQPLAIGGCYGGFSVEIKLLSRDKKSFTEISVLFPRPLDLGLEVSRAGFWTRLALGQTARVETGASDLDRSVTISSRDTVRSKYIARSFEVQQALRSLLNHQGFEINDRGVTFNQDGYQTDYNKVKTLLDDAIRALQSIIRSLSQG